MRRHMHPPDRIRAQPPPAIRNNETCYFSSVYCGTRCGVAAFLSCGVAAFRKIGDWYCDGMLRKQISLLNLYY